MARPGNALAALPDSRRHPLREFTRPRADLLWFRSVLRWLGLRLRFAPA